MPEQTRTAEEIEIELGPAVAPAEFPLPVVTEWEELLKQSTQIAKLIDRHLDYEERGRRLLPNERLAPIGLCPEQRVNVVTDILAVARS